METIYSLTFEATIDTTLRSFQYRFLMQLIPTNIYLYRCKLTATNICDFCSMNVESIEHLFWECSYVQELWSNLSQFLKSKNIDVVFNLADICFGRTPNSTSYRCINYIIILCKFFIFRMKYRKTIPRFEHFKKYLDIRINLEKAIALERNKLEQHNRKWFFFH